MPSTLQAMRKFLTIRTLGWLAGIALTYVLVRNVALYDRQWDFHVYYGSAKAFWLGLDIYDRAIREMVHRHTTHLPYAYPPLTLYAFVPFAWLPISYAYLLFLGLKLIALAALLHLWHHRFVRFPAHPLTIFFFLYAYGASIAVDLEAGNISTFEELALWFGFAQLLSGRWWTFALTLIATSQFKIVPVFFLALLLVVPEKPRWREFIISLVVWALVTSLNFILFPDFTWRFIRGLNSSLTSEMGTLNPSAFAFVRDMAERITKGLSDRSIWIPLGLHALVSVVLIFFTARAIRDHRRAGRNDAREIIYVSCLVFALIVPRFKDYSFMLLLPGSLSLLVSESKKMLAPLFALPMFLPTREVFPPDVTLILPYASVITASIVWWLTARNLRLPVSGLNKHAHVNPLLDRVA